jgi:hypothetical protein
MQFSKSIAPERASIHGPATAYWLEMNTISNAENHARPRRRLARAARLGFRNMVFIYTRLKAILDELLEQSCKLSQVYRFKVIQSLGFSPRSGKQHAIRFRGTQTLYLAVVSQWMRLHA